MYLRRTDAPGAGCPAGVLLSLFPSSLTFRNTQRTRSGVRRISVDGFCLFSPPGPCVPYRYRSLFWRGSLSYACFPVLLDFFSLSPLPEIFFCVSESPLVCQFPVVFLLSFSIPSGPLVEAVPQPVLLFCCDIFSSPPPSLGLFSEAGP